MAVVDSLLSEPIIKLTELVIFVAKTTSNFKPELKLLDETLERIKTIIHEIVNMNRELHRSEDECLMLEKEIEKAEKLVNKCSKVKRNIIKKFTYSLKLKDFNGKLLRFFQIEVQAIQTRGITETLKGVNDVRLRVESISSDLKDMRLRTNQIVNSGGSMPTTTIPDQPGSEDKDRKNYGWRVPALPIGIVAFDEPLAKLKAEVVAGNDNEDDVDPNPPVLVVAAAGGCGKTTLVKMLCHDPEIREKFGENIFFVTVSETPDFMVIVNDLFNPNPSRPRVQFQGNEDAKNKLEIFLNQKISSPMLLVLDDVWSDSFVDSFSSKNRACKILVTSRTAFPNYELFKFDPLNEEDAKTLFCQSAFTKGGKKSSPNIDENLNQMVACCKRHPLTLSVVGRSLNGKDKSIWKSTLKRLSQGSSVLDLHKDVLSRLERSFEALDDEYKDYFLDFGVFPEDQRIPVSALLNMWAHLYNHDDDGVDTLAKIFELSYRNLLDIMTTGFKDDSTARVNHCDQQFVRQHDLLRELAIHLNSKLPLAKRSRLIINAKGEDLPTSLKQVQEPMRACILSISTGESFSSKWCNMEVPDLEVLILNLMSKTYTLPQFFEGNQKLSILNITNQSFNFTQFNNFHFLTSSHNLTKIRLEHVFISSSILSLESLQKVSFIMCKIDNSFHELITNNLNIWPNLVEIEIDSCQDLLEFPQGLCNSVDLKRISIMNCHEMCGFNEGFGDFFNLETLSLRGCTSLEKFPESIWRLGKLSVLDISDCLSLSEFPEKMGELSGLRTIYMKGCSGIYELPESVEELSHVNVVCDEEMSYQWQGFSNVNVDVVEEDRFETLMKITDLGL